MKKKLKVGIMKKKEHCFHCGAKKIPQKPKIIGYSEKTGKPITIVHYRCPNDTLWNSLFCRYDHSVYYDL